MGKPHSITYDLLIDPLTAAAGYSVWLKETSIYYGIPLLNFMCKFVLMGLAPFGWMPITRQHIW
ncbi:MAG: carotenoid biosynthesis protein, partial [Gammaproteobacteria bacterium]|nr:carotenoid biosynthesis protein [Gammaproteobacteria bacterium]